MKYRWQEYIFRVYYGPLNLKNSAAHLCESFFWKGTIYMGVYYTGAYISEHVSQSRFVCCSNTGKHKVEILDSKNKNRGYVLRCNSCGHLEIFLNSNDDIGKLFSGKFFVGD
jgi:hypothetical protein